MCQGLDEPVDGVSANRLLEGRYPYLRLDATLERVPRRPLCRAQGWCSPSGCMSRLPRGDRARRRRSRDGSLWRAFLRSLVERAVEWLLSHRYLNHSLDT
jgi:hypothetical protein